ncbi:MAG TPA: Clp protease N-terminal domain-containing protein [Pseudonocardiaceae bacterium]|nr:Clp protease N-terminal domain-containing protein [Pseudonocardiaceae bacterium]
MTTDNVTRINGWITPRLERVLQRSAQISSANGYNYLAVEHVALAIIEDENSLPSRSWQGSMTADEWRRAMLISLPDPSTNVYTPLEPVQIETSRQTD